MNADVLADKMKRLCFGRRKIAVNRVKVLVVENRRKENSFCWCQVALGNLLLGLLEHVPFGWNQSEVHFEFPAKASLRVLKVSPSFPRVLTG